MIITKEQQQALDDALVPREQRLRIGNCNYRLSTTFKPKEPTFQVALDVLSLTSFYQAFLITASVPAIYMHEFWATYGAILPDTLTNQAMKESDAYKTYHDLATGKVAKSGKKKLTAQGLETLLKPALFEAEQMKVVTKRSKTDYHVSHASGSGANEGTGVTPGDSNVPPYGSKDEQISWKSSDDEDDDEVSESKDTNDNADNEDDDNEHTESDNDGDDFVHPKFSTHDEEVPQDDEDKDEECSDLRVHTPSHFESTDDEIYDEITQGDNIKEEKLDEEQTNKKEEVNEMYNDVNINLEGRDTKITNALLANVQTNQVIEDTHVIITAVTLEVQRIKALEDDFSEYKQTNLFAEVVSLILGIIDKYLANQMNEAVKATIQLQSDRLRISKILPRIEKLVNDQLEAEVLIRSSNEAKTSHVVAANLSELELKKILIDKIENNKLIDRSVQQKTLYKALVDAYETEKTSLQNMEILSRLKDVEMMRMKTKKPPLDQTGGPREEELEKNQSQLVHQKRRLPSQLASLKKGPNLIKSLLTSLLKQRNQYTILKTWKNPHIRSSIQAILKINMLMRPLSFLIGFRNLQNLQLPIVIGTRICLLLMDQFNLGSAIWVRHLMS
ncbi:hypothetical protein Tco_0600784 [Tanacetum coccineum]